jgi:hypothetical protein
VSLRRRGVGHRIGRSGNDEAPVDDGVLRPRLVDLANEDVVATMSASSPAGRTSRETWLVGAEAVLVISSRRRRDLRDA